MDLAPYRMVDANGDVTFYVDGELDLADFD